MNFKDVNYIKNQYSIKAKPLFLLVFLFSFIAHSQTNEIGISTFKLEASTITLNDDLEPIWYSGLYYIKKTNRLNWVSSIEYGENEITDLCNSCADMFYGTGFYKEMAVYTGAELTYHFPLSVTSINFDFRIKIVGSISNYSGSFSGGFTGAGFYLNRKYYALGSQVELGLNWVFLSDFVFRASFSVRYEKYKSKNKHPINSNYVYSSFRAMALPNLSLGYQF